MKKYLTKEILVKIVMLFIIIQPVLDIYLMYKDEAQILGFALPTIVRMGFIATIFILALFTISFNKKSVWLFIYGGLVSVYFILHHINALDFTSYVPGDFGYSIGQELFYIIRMLMPLLIIYISYNIEFTTKKMGNIVTWLVALISGSIVLSNLYIVSLGSYSKVTIQNNIFSWFEDNYNLYNYIDLASKGFFNDPNRIAALSMIVTSILIYQMIKDFKIRYVVLFVIQALAMFMIGTKVSSFGFIIITVICFVGYLFFTIIKKDFIVNSKIVMVFIAILALCAVILPFSPNVNRKNVDDQIENEYSSNVNGTITKEKDKLKKLDNDIIDLNEKTKNEYLISFIKNEYVNFSINPQFIEKSYPYKYDPQFWIGIMKMPLAERTDFRYVEKLMLDRVKEVNGDKQDVLYGITFTRMSNIFDYERDFKSHFYTLGIFGFVLFLFPYIAILLLAGIISLIKFKEKFNIKVAIYTLGTGLAIFAGFYSGNVMDGLIVTIILGFIMGQLLQEILRKEKEDHKEKVSVIMPSYNDSDNIIETIESLVNQNHKNWELIIVDDGSTDDTKEIIYKYTKESATNDRIKYIYQENQDQLNAVITGSKLVTGEYVYVLHSDDLLASKDVFSKSISKMKHEKSCDALIADLIIINKFGKITGKQEIMSYTKSEYIKPLQLLWLGRNLFVDVAFYKKEVFLKQVDQNYLKWNTPFWLDLENENKALNVVNVDFPFLKYRVYGENYINNEIGKLNVMNGELRTLTRLMKYYTIPKYEIQFKIFRAFNKLGLLEYYRPLYFKKETKDKESVLKYVITKRFSEGYTNNIFLDNLVKFYGSNKKRTIEISKLSKNEVIYFGKDIRAFNKKLLKNELSDLYNYIIKEMGIGFDEIKVTSVQDKENIENIVKFLCIHPYVEIKVKKKRG